MYVIRYVNRRNASTLLLHVQRNFEQLLLVWHKTVPDMDYDHAEHADMPDKGTISRQDITSTASVGRGLVIVNLISNTDDEHWNKDLQSLLRVGFAL